MPTLNYEEKTHGTNCITN